MLMHLVGACRRWKFGEDANLSSGEVRVQWTEGDIANWFTSLSLLHVMVSALLLLPLALRSGCAEIRRRTCTAALLMFAALSVVHLTLCGDQGTSDFIPER